MKKAIFFSFLLVFCVACNKGKFKTQPTVTINSFGPPQVPIGGIFSLNATVTDKEGDLQDSVLLVEKLYNPTTNFLLRTDTSRFGLKDFGIPTNQKIEVNAVFDNGQLVDGTIEYSSDDQSVDRQLSIGVIVIDNAGHRSDYVESGKITLQKL